MPDFYEHAFYAYDNMSDPDLDEREPRPGDRLFLTAEPRTLLIMVRVQHTHYIVKAPDGTHKIVQPDELLEPGNLNYQDAAGFYVCDAPDMPTSAYGRRHPLRCGKCYGCLNERDYPDGYDRLQEMIAEREAGIE